jgi:predicted GNAT family acetyltransferase
MNAAVVPNPQASRYEIHAGGTRAGFAEYVRSGDVMAFTHTQIDRGHEGQGLGSLLVRGALDAVRADGLAVLPYCPFVRGFMSRHPEYAELVPAGQRHEFGLDASPQSR